MLIHEMFIDNSSVFSSWRRSIGTPCSVSKYSPLRQKPIPYKWGRGKWDGALGEKDPFFSRWVIKCESKDGFTLSKRITFVELSVFSILPEKEWWLDVSIGI